MSLQAPDPNDAAWKTLPPKPNPPPDHAAIVTASIVSEQDGIAKARFYTKASERATITIVAGDMTDLQVPAKCVTPVAALCDHCRALVLHEEP